ncbi:MAG: ThiF family adenylyltransferase [Patescibacteria group bacterium]
MHTPRFYHSKAALPKGARVRDTFDGAVDELFFIEHPAVSKQDSRAPELLKKFRARRKVSSLWVYYPWLHTAVRIPSQTFYEHLRTARNRNLIRPEEQKKFRQSIVGVAGLSVGSAVVASLVATGGPRRLKIADPDTIEITNLNRMRATLADVGENKAVVAAQNAWEIDPFAQIEVWDKGIQTETVKKFITAKPTLDVFVDEMDDIRMKVEARLVCKKARIPVVMATDNGDSIIVDVERFDQEPSRPLFHGRVTLTRAEMATMTRSQFVALSTRIIDPAHLTTRQQESIRAIGSELAGIAQLGTAAALAGAAVSYVVRRIVCGEPLPSGRYSMGCEPTFIPGYLSAREKQKRTRHTRAFVGGLGAH